MSDPQGQKKKSKKKKKSSTPVNPAPPALPQDSQNGVEKDAVSIKEVLPQKVGMKTVFKDVEVTMTHSGNSNEVTNGTIKKKKKKKKKSKQQPPVEATSESTAKEAEPKDNFFKFSEDRIELLNHPEISVTLSKTIANQEKESAAVKEKVDSVTDSKNPPDVTTSTNSKKKKKKKKKKVVSLPPEPVAEIAEEQSTAPTYVKLPAAGGSCVLLVSHESFSNNSNTNTLENSSSSKGSETVLLQNREKIAEAKGNPSLNSVTQPEPLISILPVLSNPGKASSGNTTELNMNSSLQKVSDKLKNIKNTEPSLESTNNTKDSISTEESTMTKAQLKAERRAKQEAQRAAKSVKNNAKDSATTTQPKNEGKVQVAQKAPPTQKHNISENSETPINTSSSKSLADKETVRKVQIFSHLPQSKDFAKLLNQTNSKIHPAILEIGFHYNKGILCGSNSRCVGFLAAFREVINDYKTPSGKEFSRDLEAKLQTYLNFLNDCRPLSVSIQNTVKFLKHQINHLPKHISEETAKKELCTSINTFVREDILLAKEAICILSTPKIVDGDSILVFAYSSLVMDVLCKAHDQNKSFHVIVVDSRPKMEGQEMLRRLVKYNIRCSYTHFNSVSYVMKKVSKVILGSHALLSNGCVMSRVGCKHIVQVASSCSVPVLVCCETYKFCERALTDSFVHNELGKPEELVQISLDKNKSLENWQSLPSLRICNILYDVTPSDMISVVITEKGLLPCTSVPVVLRVKHAGLQE